MIECELLTKTQNDLGATLLQAKQDMEEYKEKLKYEFETEWSKKKFKWFFKKYRQRKLKTKIYRRHCRPIFELVEDVLEDIIPKKIDILLDNLVDIKDVSLGDKNYFVDEKLIDKFNSYGCTSFMLTSDEIEQLEKENEL